MSLITSRNNYNLLYNWLNKVDTEGFDILNIDEFLAFPPFCCALSLLCTSLSPNCPSLNHSNSPLSLLIHFLSPINGFPFLSLLIYVHIPATGGGCVW